MEKKTIGVLDQIQEYKTAQKELNARALRMLEAVSTAKPPEILPQSAAKDRPETRATALKNPR
jgi:hypothetical protein